MKSINCIGLGCPIPVINTKKYFETIEEGEAEVIVDNEVSKSNVEKFAKNSGFDVDIKVNEENNYILSIKKNKDKKKIKEIQSTEKNKINSNNKLVIVVASDELGNGDKDLGKTLMKSYIYALSESSKKPTELIFLNSGVNLTVENSVVLESLKELEKSGTKIYSCGACLDFYGLKDSLGIGEITNMYSIIEMMNNGDKVIKL